MLAAVAGCWYAEREPAQPTRARGRQKVHEMHQGNAEALVGAGRAEGEVTRGVQLNKWDQM